MKNPSYQEFKSFCELSRLRSGTRKVSSTFSSNEMVVPVDLPDNLTDDQLFELSTKDVVPLGWSTDQLKAKPISQPRQSPICNNENLMLLQEVVRKIGEIDLRNSGEYIEGIPHPEGSRWLSRLRKGFLSIQAHLDLHGLTLTEARESFDAFVHQSLIHGYSCVRVVHGRGKHSKGNQPKLKKYLVKWLNTRRMSNHVIAYSTARLVDGGGGALYILLGRE